MSLISLMNMFRFEPVPEAGKHKGLTLVLDAHQDLVSASSVSEDYQVKVYTLPVSQMLHHLSLVVGVQCNN